MTQRHLGCIGNPSKITDTPNGEALVRLTRNTDTKMVHQ